MYHGLVWTDRTVHALNLSAERRIEYQNVCRATCHAIVKQAIHSPCCRPTNLLQAVMMKHDQICYFVEKLPMVEHDITWVV